MELGSNEARARYAAFLYSLFTCAPKRISNVDRRGTPLAKWWYNYLNADETKDSPGSKRMKFYEEVVKESEVRNLVACAPELPPESNHRR